VDGRNRATVFLRVNFIEELQADGIAVYGNTQIFIDENVVFRTGTCGVKIDLRQETGEVPGQMWRNYIVHTGQDPTYDDGQYCAQCPLALHNVPEGFELDDNTYYDNRRVSECDVPKDKVREWFWRKRRSYLRKYRNTKIGVDGRHSFWDSSFLHRYSRF
jgi:hypothetical protein